MASQTLQTFRINSSWPPIFYPFAGLFSFISLTNNATSAVKHFTVDFFIPNQSPYLLKKESNNTPKEYNL